ncbi:glycosyltransferase [Arthrobacter sp. NPDC055585]
MAEWAEVLVVDGSEPKVFQAHTAELPPGVVHLAPVHSCLNGKVAGVLTGLEAARTELCVIADDDVRYSEAVFGRVLLLLEDGDVVRPQNYFCALPWHARWDTARSLLNRALGSDYPGTLGGAQIRAAARRGLQRRRPVRESGTDPHGAGRRGREVRAPALNVARRPCSARHFWSQRVRQAYDDFAQPARLAAELALLPVLIGGTRRFRLLPAAAAVCAAGLAEAGRRRDGGAEVFPATSALWAPLWVLERSLAVWVAL